MEKEQKKAIVTRRKTTWFAKRFNKKSVQLHERRDDSILKNRTDSDSRFNYIFENLNKEAHESLESYGSKLLSLLARENELLQGVIFIREFHDHSAYLRFACGYACSDTTAEMKFKPGDGLPGQVYNDRKPLNLRNLSEGYVSVKTALGEASPKSLLLVPFIRQGETIGIMELATFKDFNEEDENFYMKVATETATRLEQLIKNQENN